MERSKAGKKKKKSRMPIIAYSKYNNNIHNIVEYYKMWKKYIEIQSTKKK